MKALALPDDEYQFVALQLLREVSLECQYAFDEEVLAYRITYLLSQMLHIHRIGLAVIQQHQLHFVATNMGGMEQFLGVLPMHLPLNEESLSGWVAINGKSLLVVQPQRDRRYYAVEAFSDTVVELVVPIMNARQQILGIINLQSTNYHDEQRFINLQPTLEQACLTLGIGLETMTLHAKVLRRNRYNQMLEQIRSIADQQLDLTVLMEAIVSETRHHLHFRGIAIYLVEYNHLALRAQTPTLNAPQRRPLPGTEHDFQALWTPPLLHRANPSQPIQPGMVDIPLLAGSALLGVLMIQPLLPIDAVEFELLSEAGKALGQLIERMRLFTSMYATNERTTLFARIVSVVRQSLNIFEVIHPVSKILCDGLKIDWCGLGVFNRSNELQWVGTYYDPNTFASHDDIAEHLRHEVATALLAQRTGIIDDLQFTTQIEPPTRTMLTDHGVRAIAWSPLQIADESLGALCVYTIELPRRWSLDELRLLSDVADQLAIAYRQMQIYEAEQQRRRELEALQAIIEPISGELNLVALCKTVVAKVLDVFNLSAAAVLMANEPQEAMKPIASVGLSNMYTARLILQPAEVAQWLQRFPSPQAVYIPQLSEDPLIDREAIEQEGLGSLYAQPLLVNGVFSGWLQMYRHDPFQPFKPHERRLATAIATQIAQAMHTAQRYAKERLLRTDAEQSYTNLRAVLDELEQTREHLLRSEKLRALGVLASGVAHDFNNLLAAILGNTQDLLQDEPPGKHREALSMIEQAARDGAVTVRRIQEFARSAETVYDEIVDLCHVVEIGLEFARPSWRDQAQQRGITITIKPELQPAFVLGSAAELREVFLNLLVNAVDALPMGGTITVTSRSQGDQAIFTVADNGRGVTPENRARIFDPFFTTKQSSQGTGLGLAVALSIVQRHRGTLVIEDVKPHGARFVATFPLHRSPDPAPRLPKETHQAVQRILVVDDDSSVRQVVTRLLQRDRHEVAVASSGEQALELLAAASFDILISDLGMPGLNGWQVLAAARKLDPSIRTMLLTGWGYQLDGDNAPAHLADVIMSKPFEMQELRQAIARLINGEAR